MDSLAATRRSDYPTSWLYQMSLLFKRDAEAHWRDPTYLLSKVALNIGSALLIGFSFYQAKTTIQGTQNHLFVSLGSPPRVAAVLTEARRRSSCP